MLKNFGSHIFQCARDFTHARSIFWRSFPALLNQKFSFFPVADFLAVQALVVANGEGYLYRVLDVRPRSFAGEAFPG